MFFWFLVGSCIVAGVIIVSLSISNPFFKLIFRKKLNINVYLLILFKIILFFLGIALLIVGLVIESVV